MNKTLGLLTICKKAGKLIMGMDSVKDACNSFKASCVLVTTDISEKSLKEARFVCSMNEVPLLRLDVSMDDVWYSLGRKSGIIAVCDDGFTKKLSGMLEKIDTSKK